MDTSPRDHIRPHTILEIRKEQTYVPSIQEKRLQQPILLQLEAAFPASLTMNTILHGIKISDPEVTVAQAEEAFDDLEERGLITIQPGTLNPARKRYQLSPLGQCHAKTYAS